MERANNIVGGLAGFHNPVVRKAKMCDSFEREECCSSVTHRTALASFYVKKKAA